MSKVKIVTDSCSDMIKELREKYDIDYLLMNTVKDGKETPASLDWEFYTPQDLYDTLRDGIRVTTTQVPAGEFEKGFRAYLQDGYDVVYVGCSSKLSGSVNTAAVVARDLLEEFPDAKICVVDAINACMGEAQVAIKAAKLRDQGLSAEEIAEQVNAVRNNVNQFVAVDSLNMLKAAGRVQGDDAYFGNLLGVKPIIISDTVGNNIPIKKVKGRAKMIEELAELTADAILEPENQEVLIAHADCEEDALELKELVEEKIPGVKIYIGYIGPIIGASIGADALGIFCWGKNIDRFSA